MLVIQRMLHPTSKKTNMSAKIGDIEIGFQIGQQLNVFQKGDILLYTWMADYPGFDYVKEAKVFSSQGRAQAQLFQPWVKCHMDGLSHLKVFYTNKGLFIKAFKGDEFNELICK